MDKLIKPHGSDSLNPLYVADDAKRAELQKEAEGLPKLLVCSQAAANAVMLGSGYFNPLTGYMSLADSLSVAQGMKTTGGQPVEVDPPGDGNTYFIATVPLHLIESRRLPILHQNANLLPQGIEDLQAYLRLPGQVVADRRLRIEWIGKAGLERET